MAFISGVSVDRNLGDVKTKEKVAIVSGVSPKFCDGFGSKCAETTCSHRGCNEIGSVEKASKDKSVCYKADPIGQRLNKFPGVKNPKKRKRIEFELSHS